jgi:hypothetical protein
MRMKFSVHTGNGTHKIKGVRGLAECALKVLLIFDVSGGFCHGGVYTRLVAANVIAGIVIASTLQLLQKGRGS